MRIFLVFLLICSSPLSIASVKEKATGVFSGRISKINTEAGLVRIKVDFANMKYLNKKDKLEFWDERGPGLRCKSYIAGKSNDYLLLKIPEIEFCKRSVFLSNGVYLKFFSQDLVNNLIMGKELVSILLKKRLALRGRIATEKKELGKHIEKVNATNMRYKLLRDKLESEWRGELGLLEEDKVTTLRNYKELEVRVMDIENKLEKYRIEDENMKLDRWALDPRLYYKK